MNLKPLLLWSKTEFSDLPWRKERSLYRTLVSEIMLQQTTVGTVRNHFERFLKKFPNLESLAAASEDELTVAWKGLGYYRRARNLKKIAEEIFFKYGGKFPDDLEILMEIPGIGPYTANALVAIGMDKRGLAVDANLERVLARFLNLQTERGPKLQQDIYRRFREKEFFSQKISYRELNEALMDLGRTYCQARKTVCELCPLRTNCKAFSEGFPLMLPLQKAQEKKTHMHDLELLRIIVLKRSKLLVYKKNENQWLSGQYEVPTFQLTTTDKKFDQYPPLQFSGKPELSYKTGITKYRIQNRVILMSEKEFRLLPFDQNTEWRAVSQEDSNFSTSTLKALALLSKV